MADKLTEMGPFIFGVIGFVYGVFKDVENKKLKGEIEIKENRLQANSMYEKIRIKKEILEDALTELVALNEESSLQEKKTVFLKTYNKYTSLYNEIEDFCAKISDGVIESESYIKETLLPIFNNLAKIQVETYKSLNNFAQKYGLEKINKPDYKAFDKYDEFLIKYNGGETSYFWRELKNMRRDYGFE